MNIFIHNTKDAYTITLGEYIILICHNKISVLKKLHIYTPKRILMQAYAHIFDQYNELTTNPDILISKNRRERLERLVHRYTKIFSCYTIIRYKDSQIAKDILKNMFIVKKGDNRKQCISKCVAVLKALNQEITELKVNEKDKKRPTIADFERSIAILVKNGYHVDKKMTLSEYIQVENISREEYESRNNRSNRNK